MVAGNSPPRSSLTKAMTSARMGHALHATRSGCDAVQFSNALPMAGFQLLMAQPNTCIMDCCDTLQHAAQYLSCDPLRPALPSMSSCSSHAGLLPFQRVQNQLNDLHRLCQHAGAAIALPNALHTLQQLPPVFKHMPAGEHDLYISLSHSELALDRSS